MIKKWLNIYDDNEFIVSTKGIFLLTAQGETERNAIFIPETGQNLRLKCNLPKEIIFL